MHQPPPTHSPIGPFLLTLLLLLPSISSLDKCTNPAATLFDGYLETQLYHALFNQSQNSFIKFGNPYQGINPLNTLTIGFWAKFPLLSADGVSQTGTFLDCNDTLKVLVNNGTFSFATFQVANATGQSNSTISNTYSQTSLSNWQAYTFSVNYGTQYMFLNTQLQSQSMGFSLVSATSNYCSIGNSLAMTNPINAQMRHLYFLNTGISGSTNMTVQIHIQPLPAYNLLSYFKFSRKTGADETYYFNTTRNLTSSGVLMKYEIQPEFVCYCSGTYPNYVNVSSLYTLNPITLADYSSYNVEATGFNLFITFIVFKPWNLTLAAQDTLLFSITNYAYLYLTNNSNVLRLDVYSSSNSVTPSASMLFTSYQFKYFAWTTLNIVLTKTVATLQVDGILVQQISFSRVSLPTSSPSFQIYNPSAVSYLLGSIVLKNQRSSGQLLLNLTFSQDQMNIANQTKLVSVGTMLFGSSNQNCNYNDIKLTTWWTGLGCAEPRIYPYFDGTKTGYLQTAIPSSQSSLTIELWVRDLNTLASQTQVIFENTLDGTSPLIQIGITTGTSTIAATSLRTVYCTPYLASNASNSMQVKNVVTYNTWTHLTCTSDSTALTTTFALYNSSSAVPASTSISNYIFYNTSSKILTSLGSKIDGSSKFSGFIRELRIWANPRSLSALSMYRFMSQKASTDSLIYYFKGSDQMNPLALADAQLKYTSFEEQMTFDPLVSYNLDKDLIVCQEGLVYDGQCCAQFDISNATFTITYTTSNLITVQLDPSSVLNQNVFSTLYANFSLSSLANNYQVMKSGKAVYYQSTIASLFSFNSTTSFTVSAALINPLTGSLTIQALVYSLYYPDQYTLTTQTLKLSCPVVFLNILPNYVTDLTQIVSMNSTDTSPIIYATTYLQCYNTTSNYVIQNTQTSVIWSTNSTSTTLSKLFTTASDSMSIASLPNKAAVITSANQYISISARLNYNGTSKYMTNSISINYAQIQINTNTTQNLSALSYLQGDIMNVDFTYAYTIPAVYNLSYTVVCPTSLFNSTFNYSTYCTFPDSSPANFSLDTNLLTMIANYPYNFYFYITIDGTSILQAFVGNTQFFKDGGLTNCPRVTFLKPYTTSIYSIANLQLIPDPYLYCSGSFYQITSANWTLADSLTNSNLSSILTYGTQSIYRSANITTTSLAKIQSGTILSTSVVFNTTLLNSAKTSTSSSATTTITFAQQALAVNINAFSTNGTALVNNTVSFTTQTLILNATNSSDPDNSTNVLSFSWTCPTELSSIYICQSLIKGSAGQLLYINALQRAKARFLFNTPYNFSVTASVPSNPYKTPITTTISITFSAPTANDAKLNTEMTAACDNATAGYGAVSGFNSSYSKVVRYDVLNQSNSYFYISSSVVSSCKTTPVDQLMFVYFTDSQMNTLPQLTYVFEQSTSTGIQTSTNTSFNLSSNFNLSAANYSQVYPVNIYWFTQRNTSSDIIYLNIDTVYVYRQKAGLVIGMATPKITVDKYNILVINASTSYDPEYIVNNTYTFKWTCPSTVVCSNQTSSILTLPYINRQVGGANSNGSVYTYSVIMTDSTRNSSSASSSVTVLQQANYSSCLNQSLNTTSLNSYSASSNQTLYLQYNQATPVILQMLVSVSSLFSSCSILNLETTSFYPYASSQSAYWQSNPYNITLNNTLFMSQLYPSGLSTILFRQQYTMGIDSATKYFSYSYVNVNLTFPNIMPTIIAPRLAYLDDSNLNIILDAGSSIDPYPSPVSFSWNCPSYFGGDSCSSLARLTLSQSSVTENQISTYYNQTHLFTVTLTPSLFSERAITKKVYLFLSDPSNGPFIATSANTCGIYQKNDSGASILGFANYSIFIVNCSNNATLTSSLTVGSSIKWSVDGLTENSDYFSANNQLYLNPFAASKLTASEIVVSATFSGALSFTFMQAFDVQSDQLNYDSSSSSNIASISLSPSSPQFYLNQSYALSFSNFQSTRGYGIQMQLRAYSSKTKSNQMLFPISPYTDTLNALLYSALAIPEAASLYFDFFDMNLNYMGSYDLIKNNLPSIATGSISQQGVSDFLSVLSAKSNNSYPANKWGTYQYLVDLAETQRISSALAYSHVTFDDSSALTAKDFALPIIQVLSNTTLSMIANINSSESISMKQAKDIVEKNTVSILAELVGITDIDYSANISSVVSILEQIQTDYANLINTGDDNEHLKSRIVKIINNTNLQLQAFTSSSGSSSLTTSLNSRLVALNTWIIGRDFSSLSTGSTTSVIDGKINKVSLIVDSTSSSSVVFTSSINSVEQVLVPSQAAMSSYSVSSMQVQYTASPNSTAPGATSLTIDAYDSSYNLLALNFTSLSSAPLLSKPKSIYSLILDSVYTSDAPLLKDSSVPTTTVYFTLQAKDSYISLFNDTFFDDSQTTVSYPVCVFFDTRINDWSTQGLTNVSYDYDTGVLNCSTTHFSLFSMDYMQYNKIIIFPPDNTSNSTNTTLHYFKDSNNQLYYYLGVGISAFITILLVFISCISFTEWDARSPDLETLRAQNAGCCGACKSACLLHSLIISAFCGPKKTNVHIMLPKVSKMIDMGWLFWAILAGIGLTMWQLPDSQWTNQLDIQFTKSDLTNATMITNQIKDYTANMELCGIVMGVILIGRMFVLTIGYTIYFIGKGPEMALKGSTSAKTNDHSQNDTDKGTDLEDNQVRKPKAKKGKKKKPKARQYVDEDNQFEGGSSDEEEKQPKPKKKKRAAASKSKERPLMSSSLQQQQEALKQAEASKKKSGSRYDAFEAGTSSKQKSGHDSSADQKNIVDMIDQIDKIDKSKKGISTARQSASSEVQPQGKKKFEKKAEPVMAGASRKLASDDQEKPPSKAKSRKVRSSKSKSPVKKLANNLNKEDLFIDDNEYIMGQQSQKTASRKKNPSNDAPNYRQVKKFQDEPITEEYKTTDASKQKKKKKRTVKGKSSSPSREMSNYRINNSTQINSSDGESFYTKDDKSTEKSKKGKKPSKTSKNDDSDVDTDFIRGQYSKSKWCTLAIKFLLMLGCMGISYWMMWNMEDLPHLYSWLAMGGLVFFVLALILQPIFIAIFAVIFGCTKGSGCCVRFSSLLLLGNGHKSVVDGILYDLNN